jgi:REP element-mobilizing transposase RayT
VVKKLSEVGYYVIASNEKKEKLENMQLTIDQATTIADTRVFVFQKPAPREKPRLRAENVSGLYYHLVFKSNKNLDHIEAGRRRKFFGFISGCMQNLQVRIESVGGKGGSVHLLVALDPSQTPADFINKLKLFSSAWAKRKLDMHDFRWLGEEVSTVSQSERRRVSWLIESQGFSF